MTAAARFGNAPRVQHGEQPGQLGVRNVLGELLSFAGRWVFQSSFWLIGMMTSLNSGFPSRDTWVYGPLQAARRRRPSRTPTWWRLAVVQTPMTGAACRVGRQSALVSR